MQALGERSDEIVLVLACVAYEHVPLVRADANFSRNSVARFFWRLIFGGGRHQFLNVGAQERNAESSEAFRLRNPGLEIASCPVLLESMMPLCPPELLGHLNPAAD